VVWTSFSPNLRKRQTQATYLMKLAGTLPTAVCRIIGPVRAANRSSRRCSQLGNLGNLGNLAHGRTLPSEHCSTASRCIS
jgi:hypothetical protein